jgi:hypothetical protein
MKNGKNLRFMKKKFGRIDSKHENNYEDFRENVNPFFLPRP